MPKRDRRPTWCTEAQYVVELHFAAGVYDTLPYRAVARPLRGGVPAACQVRGCKAKALSFVIDSMVCVLLVCA